MLRIALFLVLAGSCGATRIDLPFDPGLQDIGRVKQRVSDLTGFGVTAHFGSQSVTCYFGGGLDNDACGDWFTARMVNAAGNWNRFLVTNKSGARMTGVDFNPLTILNFRHGKEQMFGHFAIDVPGLPSTFGSGVGHPILGQRILGYTLTHRLTDDLYGGVNLRTNVGAGQNFGVRLDVDELVASPLPPSMLLMGTGIVGIGIKLLRKRTH